MRKFLWVLTVFFALFLFSSHSFAAGITSKEFLASRFVKAFQKKEYKKALKESDLFLKKHPRDPLILRYRALTLEKLNHPKHAIRLYQGILAAHPKDIPARLFLGLAYKKKKEFAKAGKQLRFVAAHAQYKEYRHWAQAQLNRLHRNVRIAAREIKKKPYLIGKAGIAYDSNPLLIPDNPNLVTTAKTASARYSVELDAGYPLWLKNNFRADILYIGEFFLHNQDASEVNFISQGAAFDAKRRIFIGKHSMLLGGRYDFRANLLDNNLYSIVNRFFVSADTSFSPKTQTHFYGRFGILNYEADGANPAVSSRDGVRGGFGMTQYFFKSDFKSFIFIKGEGNFDQARGNNFDRWGALARIGYHTPLSFIKKTDWDVSTGFDWGMYPHFASLSALDQARREDERLDVYTGITHHWKSNLASRLFYRFIHSANDNSFFDRTRHIAGGKFIFAF